MAEGITPTQGTSYVPIKPPSWRVPLAGPDGPDLGYPDYHIARPGHGQKEELLTFQTVRQGYQPPHTPSIAPGMETISLAAPIYEKLKNAALPGRMEALAAEIEVLRRGDDSVAPHSYRPPTRTIHNPQMRQNFLQTLSDNSIPLSKIVKTRNIPHGIKGMMMLDLLYTGRVEKERAGWFVGVVGGLEVQALRNKPSTSTQLQTPDMIYSIDFTKTLTSWWAKHLETIVPASSPSAKTAATGEGDGTEIGVPVGWSLLEDEVKRMEWVEKWQYMRHLSKELLDKKYLDHLVILNWFSSQTRSAHPILLSFILELLEIFFRNILQPISVDPTRSSGLEQGRDRERLARGKRLLRAFFSRIEEFGRLGPAGTRVLGLLSRMIKMTWNLDKGFFCSPKLWDSYEPLLRETIWNGSTEESRREYDRLRKKSEYLGLKIGRPRSSSNTSGSKGKRADLDGASQGFEAILDNVGITTDLLATRKTLFEEDDRFQRERRADLKREVKRLLSWMVKRQGICSWIGVAILNGLLEDDLTSHPEPENEKRKRKGYVVRTVLDWLKGEFDHRQGVDVKAVPAPIVSVLDDLVRGGIIEYRDYIGFVIASGVAGKRDEVERAEIEVLRELPSYEADLQDTFQRGMLLFRSDPEGRKQEEHQVQRSSEIIGRYLTGLISDTAPSSEEEASTLLNLPDVSAWVMWKAWSSERIKLQEWISTCKEEDLTRRATFAKIVTLLEYIKDRAVLLELCHRVDALGVRDDTVSLNTAQQLQRYMFHWQALGKSAEASMMIQRAQTRLSIEIRARSSISDSEAVAAAVSSNPSALASELLRDVMEIHRQPTIEAVDRFTKRLTREFPQNQRVIEQVWNLALTGLTDLDVTLLQPEGQCQAVGVTTRLLQSLGDHLPGSMESAFRKWARVVLSKPNTTGLTEQSSHLLLELLARRVISVRGVLDALVLPLWRSIAALSGRISTDRSKILWYLSGAILDPQLGGETSRGLSAATRIGLAAESDVAMQDPVLVLAIIRHLPFLAVLASGEETDPDASQLIQRLCRTQALRLFAAKNEVIVKEGLLKPPFNWEGHDHAYQLIQESHRTLTHAYSSGKNDPNPSSFPLNWPYPTPESTPHLKKQLRQIVLDVHEGSDVSSGVQALRPVFESEMGRAHGELIWEVFQELGSDLAFTFGLIGFDWLVQTIPVLHPSVGGDDENSGPGSEWDGRRKGNEDTETSISRLVFCLALAFSATSGTSSTSDPNACKNNPTQPPINLDRLATYLDSLRTELAAGRESSRGLRLGLIRLVTGGRGGGALGSVIGSGSGSGAGTGAGAGAVAGAGGVTTPTTMNVLKQIWEVCADEEERGLFLDGLSGMELDWVLGMGEQGGKGGNGGKRGGQVGIPSIPSRWESMGLPLSSIPEPHVQDQGPGAGQGQGQMGNARPIDLHQFDPLFLGPAVSPLQEGWGEWEGRMLRPVSERDLGTGGLEGMGLGLRSRIYGFEVDEHDGGSGLGGVDEVGKSLWIGGRGVSGVMLEEEGRGTGDDPIEIEDSPSPRLDEGSVVVSKGKKRAGPGESPGNGRKGTGGGGVTSSRKKIRKE